MVTFMDVIIALLEPITVHRDLKVCDQLCPQTNVTQMFSAWEVKEKKNLKLLKEYMINFKMSKAVSKFMRL